MTLHQSIVGISSIGLVQNLFNMKIFRSHRRMFRRNLAKAMTLLTLNLENLRKTYGNTAEDGARNWQARTF